VAFGVVAVQEAVGRLPSDHLAQLPAQIHRVLHTGVEALPAHRVVDVRGVAGEQDPPAAIGGGLSCRIGEPGKPSGTVNPIVGPVHGDECLT
jgi:hypothetical protein